MKISHTGRGFEIGEFVDRYGEECSIQKSSLATEDCIWLGVNDVIPKVMISGKGWVPVPLPEGVATGGRMHLTQDLVKELLPLLQHFARTGELPYEEEKEVSVKPLKTWYVGVMNDTQFIIDQKPCPPTDFVHPGHEPAPKVIAKVFDQETAKEETDANARLLAAAPELLQAVLAWKRWHENPDAYPTSEMAPWGLTEIALDKVGQRQEAGR